MEKNVEGTPRRTRLQLRRENGQTFKPKDTSAVPVTAEQMAIVTTTKSKLPGLTKSDKEANRRYIQVEASSSRSETPTSTHADDNSDEFDNSQSDTYIEASDTYIEASDSDEITTEIKQLKNIKDEDNNSNKEAHRCRIDPLLKLLHDLRSRLVDATGKSKLPSNVPFARLFNSVLEGPDNLHEVSYRKSTIAVKMILAAYDVEMDAFRIGQKWVPFTPSDIVVILGVPMTGAVKEIFSRDATKSSLLNRYFEGVKNLSRDIIEGAIRTLAAEEDIKLNDVTKLLVLYLACTFLFPNSNMYIGKSFLNHLESLEILSKMNWPMTLHKDMMNRIRQNINTPLKMTGSVILLLFWLCEHTSLGEKIDGRHNAEPRALRWNISGIGSKLDKLEISAKQLAIYPTNQVNVELCGLSEDEKRLLHSDNNDPQLNIEELLQNNHQLQERNNQLETENKALVQSNNVLHNLIEEFLAEKNFNWDELYDRYSNIKVGMSGIRVSSHPEENQQPSLGSYRSPIRDINLEMDEVAGHEVRDVHMTRSTDNRLDKGKAQVESNEDGDTPIEILKKRKSTPSMVEKVKERRNRKQKYKSSEWYKDNHKKAKLTEKNQGKANTVTLALEDGYADKTTESIEENRIQLVLYEDNEDDTTNIGLKLKDVTTCEAWSQLKKRSERAIVKAFFDSATTSTIAWADEDSGIEIKGSDLEDLISGKHTQHAVVDWFALDLQNTHSKTHQFLTFSSDIWGYIEEDKEEMVNLALVHPLKDTTKWTEFLLFPINTNTSIVPYRWKLLVFDTTDGMWTICDPLSNSQKLK